jgi:hypothetical protein
MDWVIPIISGLSGVAGAAVGASATLRATREERAAEDQRRLAAEHSEFVAALGNYVQAANQLADEIFAWALPQSGWNKLMQSLAKKWYGPRVVALKARRARLPIIERIEKVLDRYYAASGRLILIAPPDVLAVMTEVENVLVRKWRKPPQGLRLEWQPVSERMHEVFRAAAFHNLPLVREEGF